MDNRAGKQKFLDILSFAKSFLFSNFKDLEYFIC